MNDPFSAEPMNAYWLSAASAAYSERIVGGTISREARCAQRASLASFMAIRDVGTMTALLHWCDRRSIAISPLV
ncbi:hypothetical protein [Mesorhizobium sp.]|uniref:hypothetical protein n=1 Tax=Mesorhizobium sp. TaxID=1871066 RepID=UPI00121D2DA2|nr:hypothetical protein [Mesorhizobium sp.]TIQ03829.1 MAG: hypothetical protein E5X50_26205 [Mesorhizobium sp.]